MQLFCNLYTLEFPLCKRMNMWYLCCFSSSAQTLVVVSLFLRSLSSAQLSSAQLSSAVLAHLAQLRFAACVSLFLKSIPIPYHQTVLALCLQKLTAKVFIVQHNFVSCNLAILQLLQICCFSSLFTPVFQRIPCLSLKQLTI